jgi:hypothetical protein
MTEVADSNVIFEDNEFFSDNSDVSETWTRIGALYPEGMNATTLLPEKIDLGQFEQGDHFECFALVAMAVLHKQRDILNAVFVTKAPRRDGRYTFRLFGRGKWETVVIDDRIPMIDDSLPVYCSSPTKHWWPLLLEKALAKFYRKYSNLEGCTLHEAMIDITGHPVLTTPLDVTLAKAVFADLTDPAYWLGLTAKIATSKACMTALSRPKEAEAFGMRDEQTYGVFGFFPIDDKNPASSVDNLVVRIYNPFEEDSYTGPYKLDDPVWASNPGLKQRLAPHKNIFILPLSVFLKVFAAIDACMFGRGLQAPKILTFDSEWRDETAGGNPTNCSFRKNPKFVVRNTSSSNINLLVMLSQEDQRIHMDTLGEGFRYVHMSNTLLQSDDPEEIPTPYITSNNHRTVFKGLYLSARDVCNKLTVPAGSLCYLVPSQLQPKNEGFALSVYEESDHTSGFIEVEPLNSPLDWMRPATDSCELTPKEKDRVDFMVDCPTEVHILLTQKKPFPSKNGGDHIAEDFCGMHLYDSSDRKLGGTRAATNFREIAIVYKVAASGRYAISLTCPRGRGQVPITISIVASRAANVRIVDPPSNAVALGGDDDAVEDESSPKMPEPPKTSRPSSARNTAVSPIPNATDYSPQYYPRPALKEVPDSDTPFRDEEFQMNNEEVADEWKRIWDLYPEGRSALQLLPDKLSVDHFEQGDHFECFMLTAMASLIANPDIIRLCFGTKKPRRDGRYEFQFYRYGQWISIVIDDRIPLVEGNTIYVRSPTKHWWPLLLEKAIAKLYTLYANLEGCSLQDVLRDLTGLPVVNVPIHDLKLAEAAGHHVDEIEYWQEFRALLPGRAVTALTLKETGEPIGMRNEQTYAILGIEELEVGKEPTLKNTLVHLHCPFAEDEYTGPMNKDDKRWSQPMKIKMMPERQNHIFMPIENFLSVFACIQIGQLTNVVPLPMVFTSEWNQVTCGGNPTLISWRKNPMYVIENVSPNPINLFACIEQEDQRSVLHELENGMKYIQCGIVLVNSQYSKPFPTFLVTSNNHRSVHRGLFLNTRENANMVTIPAKSLCYLVPTPMTKGNFGRFILSLYLQDQSDNDVLRVFRPQLKLGAPAVDEFDLEPKSKDRVDFMIDCPSEVHILLSQKKPFAMKNGGDHMTEDFVGVYLYDEKDKKIAGLGSATNFRESGLSFKCPKAGRYAVSITCPRAKGLVPTEVSVWATPAANVRLVDPPTDAGALFDVDLSFLPQEPRRVPLSELQLDDNDKFNDLSTQLKNIIVKEKEGPEKEAKREAAEKKMIDFVDAEALKLVQAERPKYTDKSSMDVPHMQNKPFTDGEEERYYLKRDPRNAPKVRALENSLWNMALDFAKKFRDSELDFLKPPPNGGVPLKELPLGTDKVLNDILAERRALLDNPAATPKELAAVEQRAQDRVNQLAGEQIPDREYLKPKYYSLSRDDLPLDKDPEFKKMEGRRASLIKKREPVRDIEGDADKHCETLSRKILEDQLENCDQNPHNIPIFDVPLFEDAHALQLMADLYRLKKDPVKNKARIPEVEADLDDRVHELAKAKKIADRKFLDPEPEGVPLDSLPLDADKPFQALEKDLRKARQDPKKNAGKISELQDQLQERAKQLAKEKKGNARAFLDPDPENMPLEDVPLDDDKEFLAMEKDLAELSKDPKRNAKEIKELQNEMNERAHELAKAKKASDRAFLEPRPHDVAIEDVPLDDDKKFVALEKELKKLRKDPKKNAGKIQDLQQQMNDRTKELAKELKAAERAFLSPEPEGLPLADVPLDADADFTDMSGELRALRADPKKNAKAIAELQKEMNDRAHELAKAKKAADREFLDQDPKGVPIAKVPIDNDKKFLALEKELRKARQDPKKNAKAIQDLQNQMNDRAHELAHEIKSGARSFLSPEPEGIPVAEVPLDSDPEFNEMERELHELSLDPKKNAKAIQDLQNQMNDRAHELARARKAKDREFLDPEPQNIAIKDLPLDDDKKFVTLEKEMRRLRAADPKKHAAKIQELQGQMNDRSHEIAKEKKAKGRAFLDADPEGIPLEELPLDDDADFNDMEAELRELQADPKKNAKAIAELQKEMNDRAHDLAREKKRANRSFLDPVPEGVAIENLDLDGDKKFLVLEKELRKVKQDPKKNAAKIKDLQDQINDRAHELAKEKRKGDRAFLSPEPEGIPLRLLDLEKNEDFVEMEEKRSALSKNPKNEPQVRELEGHLKDMTHDIARELIKAERKGFLDPRPLGVPIELLPIDDDRVFRDLEPRRIKEKADTPKKVPETEQKLNDRARVLAGEFNQSNRAFLSPVPEGVPIAEVPLDTDKSFKELEGKRLGLLRDPRRNKAEIDDLEEQMNDRAHELAKEKKAGDRAFLSPEPEGVRISYIPLDEDQRFRELERDRRGLLANPKNAAQAKPIEAKLKERSHDLARDLLRQERPEYLQAEFRGVPFQKLPLDTDKPFRALEAQRYNMKKGQADPDDIADVEEKLNDRALELADDVGGPDRSFLSPEPEGIAIAELPLDKDKPFTDLEKELVRAKKAKDPKRSGQLKDKLRDRTHDIARGLLAKDRGYLNPKDPRGVDSDDLPLFTDVPFHSMELERRELKKDPKKNEKAIKELEAHLNDRADELAAEQIARELKNLSPEPEGIPLEDLHLNLDRPFQKLQKDLRQMLKDPDGNKDAIPEKEEEMNERAHAIARSEKEKDRGFLDPIPEGIPVGDLPLDDNSDFLDMEKELRDFKKDPKKNAAAIAELQKEMNDLAHELAKKQLAKEREFLDPEPEGVPLENVPIDDDKPFRALEKELRKLRKDPKNNAPRIEALEGKLNERARELAKGIKGYEDEPFHSKNKHTAPEWRKVSDLCPGGETALTDTLLPDKILPSHVESDEDGTALPACLAGLARQPHFLKPFFTPIGSRTKTGPYYFDFKAPDGTPVQLPIDPRIPVRPGIKYDTNRHWWPPLFEKAYSKFKGGYGRTRNIDPSTFFRDLLHKPVQRMHLRPPPGRAHYPRANLHHDFSSPRYWSKLGDDIKNGDAIVVVRSIPDPPDGLHKQSYYAIMAVIELAPETDDPNMILIRLNNSYHYAPYYSGPFHPKDRAWTDEMQRRCNFDKARDENKALFLPLPTFIDNFYEMHKCSTNLGEPTTLRGDWTSRSAGGPPQLCTFRNNPIFTVSNLATRSVPVTCVLRHIGDGQQQEFPETSIAVVQGLNPTVATTIPTAFLCNNSHKIVSSSDADDGPSLTTTFEVGTNTFSYIVPYTAGRDIGSFELDVYCPKGQTKTTSAYLAPNVYMRQGAEAQLSMEPAAPGKELYLQVDEPTDVHILLRQNGDDTEPQTANLVSMMSFDEGGKRLGAMIEPTNFRENAIVFRAPKAGILTLLVQSPSGDDDVFVCTAIAYASKKAMARFVDRPGGAPNLDKYNLQNLPKPAPRVPRPPAEARRAVSEPPVARGHLPPLAAHSAEPIAGKWQPTNPLPGFGDDNPLYHVDMVLQPLKPVKPTKKVFGFGTSSPRF